MTDLSEIAQSLLASDIDKLERLVRTAIDGNIPAQERLNKNVVIGSYGNFSTPYPITTKSGEPIRTQEHVIGIWLAPFEDKMHNYHQATTIYTVIKPSGWIGEPVILADDNQ